MRSKFTKNGLTSTGSASIRHIPCAQFGLWGATFRLRFLIKFLVAADHITHLLQAINTLGPCCMNMLTHHRSF